MGINVYGRKIEENLEEVRYAFGGDFDNPSGELLINKRNLEVTKIVDATDKLAGIAFLKIAAKLIRTFNKEGLFPDFIESAS